ncbi:D-alanyl-D-alanine carboxypeptidase/D-alanyl-D-alanine endopeptidase [Tunturiibacter gelidoferens]|uniref:D-alanyl-D-alanine carboxypeptidase/D-alanyl-D-alanine-endopeptidase (Penicillin-binding protein 4) n=1 Tax=Tunturiibacter lichenicola TaxID=2051959 RepID=A0A7Y9NI85_9BACT|nr:D-alanyl-D-alanine carboxypeptidase/D-alanyl-D-alanine-endopeptidase [Edaphobacter lichenicola]NYF49846.1 D-alanyl-D-alanine carboxypeptidase/D-alanyl-D-alanine-endopeptidase (penicillin-binding protein 4) [Edaphobacter lichenicola]
MMRLSGWGPCCLLGVAVCAQTLLAQTQGVGCDASVVLKAGRSGPCTSLAQAIAGLLEEPVVARDHWGIAVVGIDGAPIYALNDGQLFQPASNAKLFTTAAAMALLGAKATYQTKVLARGVFDDGGKLTGHLVLVGNGDANLSGRVLPYVAPVPGEKAAAEDSGFAPLRYLEEMADQVAATGLKSVQGDVIGDDTVFPWEPYAQDWAIDDAVWGYGAPVSALSVNDNQIKVTITPGDAVGAPASVVFDPAMTYYTLDVAGTTGAVKSGSTVQMERAPGSKVLRIYGAIGLHGQPDVEEIAIEDPAQYAALALKGMLDARGVHVTGEARARHRVLMDTESFWKESGAIEDAATKGGSPQQRIEPADDAAFEAAVTGEERTLASHVSHALAEDVVVTNKTSQNLHAELLLRQLGLARGRDGTIAQGARVVRQFLVNAGIDKDDFVFLDGSGLSGHDLVTPRATARLLQYASGQTWFADWKSSLPVGGVDGSLEGRFAKSPLKGKVFAKTGTLGEARALSGYVECASGRTVIFSIMVGNHLPQTHADRDVMDKIVAAIAAEN